MVSKRLAEVNEELNKSQARNTTLQKDLSTTAEVLRAEEAKTADLNNRLKELAAADTNQADALNSLSAKLQEATTRISELQKMSTDVENQLKDSQVMQMQKDKEIQVSCDVDMASQGQHGTVLPRRNLFSLDVLFTLFLEFRIAAFCIGYTCSCIAKYSNHCSSEARFCQMLYLPNLYWL